MSGQADTPGPRRNHERLATRLAEGALEHYGLRGAHLDLLSGGFAQVYRVQTEPGERFVLRLYGLPRADEGALRADPRLRTGPGRRSLGTLRSQVSWLTALRRETGLLVPEPIPTLGGALVGRVSVEGARTGRHCSLARWVPGTHKGRDLSPADLELVGSFVARMHGHAERYPLPEPSALPGGIGLGRSGSRPPCGNTAGRSTRRKRWGCSRRPRGG
jgi:Ser/Thr protein kinase RdoA (MazF antagonist)